MCDCHVCGMLLIETHVSCVVYTPTIVQGHLSMYTESAGETPEIVMSPPDQDYIRYRSLDCVRACMCVYGRVCAPFLCEGKCLSCSQLILEPDPVSVAGVY